jgi:hypothetical protein
VAHPHKRSAAAINAKPLASPFFIRSLPAKELTTGPAMPRVSVAADSRSDDEAGGLTDHLPPNVRVRIRSEQVRSTPGR